MTTKLTKKGKNRYEFTDTAKKSDKTDLLGLRPDQLKDKQVLQLLAVLAAAAGLLDDDGRIK
jgi:hypothetical protein